MEREVGGGIGMGNTCKPLAVSFQCMTKSTTNKKKIKKNKIKKKEVIIEYFPKHAYVQDSLLTVLAHSPVCNPTSCYQEE